MSSRLVRLLGQWDTGGAVAATLSDHMRSLILDGRLTVGEKLPSERALALELGRSRATVTTAYDRLAATGYVARVHGSGTHVTLPHQPRTFIPDAASVVDFTIASTGSPSGLHDATMQAMNRLAEFRGSSGYTLDGLPDLRERIAARYRERGVATHADQIIVTSGAMHAIAIVLATFGRAGRTALVEQPTFPHAIDALRRERHQLITTPVTPDGWDVHHLTTALLDHRPHLMYTIPDFHNPTGATLSDADRALVVATARSAGTIVLVDETTAELDIDRGFETMPMAAYGDVISVGSMSKLAWGGLRVGWIRASRERIARLIAARSSIDLGTAPLEQCIAVELLDDVPALRHDVRERLSAGRAALADGLSAIPAITMPTVRGGLSTWVDLGRPISTQLSIAAQDRGLRLPAGPRFSATPVLERYLRLPITLEPHEIRDGLTRLSAAWADVHAGRTTTGEQVLAAVV